MGASSCLNGEDTILWQGLVFYEEFLVFTGEDIVGDGSFFEWLAGVLVLENVFYPHRYYIHFLALCRGQESMLSFLSLQD